MDCVSGRFLSRPTSSTHALARTAVRKAKDFAALRSTGAELIRVKRHKFPDTHRRTAGHSLHAVRQSIIPTSPVQFAHCHHMTGEVLRHSKPFKLPFKIAGRNVCVG